MGSRRWPDLRPLCAVLIMLLAGILVAAPAAAAQSLRHTALESSEPAADSVLTESPGSISLTFTEAVQNTDTEVTVTGPDGQVYPTTPEVIGTDVRAVVPPLVGSGQFVIGYRVIAADGDAVSGEVAFVLQQPTPETSAESVSSALIETPDPAPTSATTPVPTETEAAATSASTTGSTVTTSDAPSVATTSAAAGTGSDTGSAGWVWLAIAALLIIAVGAVLLIRRRRLTHGGTQ